MSCRIAFIVTLLPQPLSPTIPTTCPGNTLKLTPSTARTVPSSNLNETRRSRTLSNGSTEVLSGPAASMTVRIGGIPETVTHQVERKHCNDDDKPRYQQPGCQRQRLDILRLLQQHAPAD